MPNNTNPAWRGGARQKVSFWSNASADNKDLISNTQAGLCRHDGGQPRHVITALSPGEARSSLRDHRVDLYETPISSVTSCSRRQAATALGAATRA